MLKTTLNNNMRQDDFNDITISKVIKCNKKKELVYGIINH